ncbi:Crp/Fnr family transcriptional regulator [Aquincola sp. S2]|uniref:Crp/Fnr family transcriptional regulator n=1 Tax=Pseudaquabacterium terrae TaxID=2732868 RepID=A0ABX2EID0_9BURK|nr:Crp/Fnr family transcriptional regulator [Aquabacterium terrae]NRF68415.1 Crp/Fnr family transcriptional regulator [Aquabacterium terrae]
MNSVTRIIEASTWGRLLTAAEFDRVAATTSERRIPAQGYVARMGEPATHWMGLAEGLLKMSVTSADGRVSTLSGVSTAAWFGEGSLIKREARRYDVIALRPSRLMLVPHATFEWLRQTSLPFNHYLQNLMNARLSLFIGMLEYGRLLDADAQVARCLAALFHPDLYPSPSPFVDLRQAEIGLLCGLSRQRVNLALKHLSEAGLVQLQTRGLTVLDVDGLRSFAGVG